MKRAAFIGAAAAFAAGAKASAQVPIAPQSRQLTIAVNVPLSGPLGAYGNQVVQGVKGAIDENNMLNALGSIVFGIRPLDDQNSASASIANVSVAAADQTIVGIVGNLTDAVTVETLTAYANDGFALVCPSVHAVDLTQRGFHNVYRLPTRDDVAGRLFATTIFRKQPSAFALAVTLDGAYGPDVARGFIQQAKADRRNVDTVTLPARAFDPVAAARAVLARSPDYLLLCGTSPQLGPLVLALHDAQYGGAFGLSDGFFDPGTISQYGTLLQNAIVFADLPPLDRVPGIFQQLADLRREVSPISALIAYGYAAAQIVIQASQRTNALTRYSLLQGMQLAGSFNTLVGPYSFGPFGDALVPNLYFYKISGTSFEYVEPAIRNGYVV
ncbi:MAG: branched-chain amino acid ABC transporter substrate-binding protein [Candidatus Tyrphobacter sp.]